MIKDDRPRTAGAIVRAEIRAELARQGLSMGDLTSRLGHPRQWLQRRLTGRTALTIDDVATVAHVLGVPFRNLTGPLDPDWPPPPQNGR